MDWQLPEADTYFRPILTRSPEGFEIAHLREALRYCKNFRVAVDGGAHIGTWSVNLARQFKCVMSFEPARDTFACLMANTRNCPHVYPYNVALGNASGFCSVDQDPTRVGNTGARTVQLLEERRGVPIEKLDYYETDNLDFLKLDVEGFELDALKGAAETIRKWRPTIMVECKEFNPPRLGGVKLVKELLASWNYKEVGGIRNDRVYVHEA